jgi:hypothetical protein
MRAISVADLTVALSRPKIFNACPGMLSQACTLCVRGCQSSFIGKGIDREREREREREKNIERQREPDENND